MNQEGAKPPRQSPSSKSDAMDTDGSPMDLYANAEALRHDQARLPEARRKRTSADMFGVTRQAARRSDAPMAALILTVFFLGFLVGRTGRS